MADKIFRVNMSDLSTRVEDVPEAWMGLGGRGLTSTIVAAEVEPTCHPLGKRNKLVFAPGLLSGTPAANSGRLSCGAKSPLTGTIKEANAGGSSAQMLAGLVTMRPLHWDGFNQVISAVRGRRRGASVGAAGSPATSSRTRRSISLRALA